LLDESVIAAWLVAFVVPYLLDLIGPNIGWLFGGVSVFATVYAYLFVPEIMVRNSHATPLMIRYSLLVIKPVYRTVLLR
jgi:hypothetical protein